MDCLFCFRAHDPILKCNERLQAMAEYIQKIEIKQETLKQASIKDFLVPLGEKPRAPKQTVIDTITISSEDEELQQVETQIKRRRKSINRCSECQDVLHDCSCGKSEAKNHQVVEMTLKDPKVKSYTQKLTDLGDFLKGKVGENRPEALQASDWLNWLIEWAERRGRCTYATGDKGLSPASAKVFFNLFLKVMRNEFKIDFLVVFPQVSKFANQWQKYICREKLYRRTQANYFSKQDVKNYIIMFNHVIENGSTSQAYYARMAKVIMSFSIIFAGCRVGALLDIRLGSVAFFSIG